MANQRVLLNVDKAKVLEDVRRHTAYVGKKASADGVNYETATATVYDADEMQGWWAAASGDVCELLKEYLSGGADDTEQGLRLVLLMPSNWNTDTKGMLEMACRDYMTDRIAARWLEMVGQKEMAGTFDSQAAAAVGKINESLYARKRPQRPWACDCNEEERQGDEI